MNRENDSLDAIERRHAARLLLGTPLVTSRSHPSDFHLIRKHADELRRDFARFCGYQLVVEGRFARLHKAGLGRNSGRRLIRTTTGSEFTPRTYTYLVLAMAALVTAPEQLLLSELLTRIRAAASEAGIELGESTTAQKHHLGPALKQLIRWQVLTETEGTIEGWHSSVDEREALLTIDTEIARRLVSGPIGAAKTPDDLVDLAEIPDRGGVRSYVRRRLVETPVVYLDDLTDDERAWLRGSQRREQENFHQWLGLDLEIRAEGAALVDEREECSDLEFPRNGTVPQAALLLIDRLVRDYRPESAGHPATGGTLVVGVTVPVERIDVILTHLVEQRAKNWDKTYVSNIRRLRTDVLRLLWDMRLMAPAGRTRADATASGTTTSPADRYVTDVRGARGQAEHPVADESRPPPGDFWVLLAAAARYRAAVVPPSRKGETS